MLRTFAPASWTKKNGSKKDERVMLLHFLASVVVLHVFFGIPVEVSSAPLQQGPPNLLPHLKHRENPKPLVQHIINTLDTSNGRHRRELKTMSRKMPSTPLPMPQYFPYIMAEVMPGTIRTRHPSIIAITGCPAYYTADASGRCRQQFRYTINYTHPPTLHQTPFYNPHIDILWSPNMHHMRRSFDRPLPTRQGRLTTLLKNAARRFDQNIFTDENNNAEKSNSGESNDGKDIDKLREQILSALKISNKNDNKDDNQNKDDDDD